MKLTDQHRATVIAALESQELEYAKHPSAWQDLLDVREALACLRVPDVVGRLISDVGGTIESAGRAPDGSGFATMSMPLPKTHWIFQAPPPPDNYEAPPMPWVAERSGFTGPVPIGEKMDQVRAAARYAIRSATMQGREMDFDPDALIQNLIIGLFGYFTPNGLSGDDWANPPHLRKKA